MPDETTARACAAMSALLPAEVDGYRPVGEDGEYDQQTLYELLNGGAEVYRSLNVRAVVSRAYASEGAPQLLVDIFDMGCASDAYGAYHHDLREGPSAGVGRESEQAGCSLFFWKHRYFVSVVAAADTPRSRAGVGRIAKAVAGGIRLEGEIPDIVRWIPQRGLVQSQLHYFHTWQLLSRYYRFASDDLLDLAADTEGVMARYRAGDGGDVARMSALVLVRYPSKERAEGARQRFAARVLARGEVELSRVDENSWAGLVRRDNLVVGVFEAPTREEAEALLAAVDRRRRGGS